MAHPLPSTLGPYEVLSRLGSGGMGEVYAAKDPRLGRKVAIKVLLPAFASSAERLARFEQEIRTLALLNHPNILQIHDTGLHEGRPFLVMELLEGENLRERLEGKPLAPRKAVEIAHQVAKGLAAAHEKGITHRDLKPENLFLVGDHVKILDFGLAKLRVPATGDSDATQELPASPSLTETGIVVGTVGYLSPEQVVGRPADARSDLFALGVILWEMVTGAKPFHRESSVETLHAILKDEPPELPAGLPFGLDRVLHRCLEKDPGPGSRRPRTWPSSWSPCPWRPSPSRFPRGRSPDAFPVPGWPPHWRGDWPCSAASAGLCGPNRRGRSPSSV